MNTQILDKRAFLLGLAARAKHVLKGNIGELLSQQLTDLAKLQGTPEGNAQAAAMQALLRSAYLERDETAFQQLLAIRSVTINNFITVRGNASSFFEPVTLKDDEVPYIENRTRQETRVSYIGPDGKPMMNQVVKEQSNTPIILRELATEDMEFPIVDIYKGNVLDQAMANVDLADDWNLKRETELWVLVKAAVGNFVTTGPRQLRTFALHSAIKAANIPTTNLITPPNTGASSKWRFDCIRSLLQWCLQWDGAMSFGSIVPEAIFVPSADLGGMLDEISTASYENVIVNQIAEVGWVVTLGGKSFTLVGDAMLDPAAGRAYCRTNVRLGQVFSKPGLDLMFPGNAGAITEEMRKKNRLNHWMKKVYAAYISNPNKMGVVGIQYRNAA